MPAMMLIQGGNQNQELTVATAERDTGTGA
jgi:hypothetical protein